MTFRYALLSAALVAASLGGGRGAAQTSGQTGGMVPADPQTVTAQEQVPVSIWDRKPWPVSHYSARVGGFWALNTTGIGIGTDKNPYSILDFENDLGMNRNTGSLLLNVNLRAGRHKRSRFDLSYYYINRSSTATLDKDIHFGDHDYPVDAEVDAFLNTNIVRFSYGYAFLSSPKVELGALVGLHVLGFRAGMSAVGNTQQFNYTDRARFTAPLPDFGLWGTWAFHRNWAVSTEAGYFSVKIDNLDGRILSGSLYLQRRLGPHWGIDVGYTLFDVKISLDRPHIQGDVEWRYNGPSITAVYRFGNK